MQNRDKSIDFLKGIAIFLMVMGHFLAFSVSHLDNVPGHNGWLVGMWIYSFHMPLFFFLTGVLSVKAPETLKELKDKILRKVQTLLIPGITFMCIGFWFYGKWSMPWFLKVLFQITVVFSVIRYFANKYHWKLPIELIVHFIVFIIWFVGSHLIKGTWAADHLWIHGAAARYPYIVLGYIYARLNWKTLFQRNNWLLTLSMVAYLLFYYICNWVIGGVISAYISEYVVAPAAIFVCVALTIKSSDNFVYNTFSFLGRKSLSIYMLHGFFLVSLPALADWWITQNNVTSIVVQLITSIFFSAICVCLCLMVEWLISQSDVLNFICFGKKRLK